MKEAIGQIRLTEVEYLINTAASSSCSHNMILIPKWTDGTICMSTSTLRDQATILHFTATVS